jgi:hypothetical protein
MVAVSEPAEAGVRRLPLYPIISALFRAEIMGLYGKDCVA